MIVLFKSTGNAPEHYSFNGETVTAHRGDVSESFDLSSIETGDEFQGVSADTLDLSPAHIIRDAYRDESGELRVTLCQAVGPGHWGESAEMDASEYDPDAIHVEFKGISRAGQPWACTRLGYVDPNTDEVLEVSWVA